MPIDDEQGFTKAAYRIVFGTVMKTVTIAFTGGGSAGHVFPAFPVIDRLRGRGFNIIWIGSHRGMERDLVCGIGTKYFAVPSGKFRRYFSFRNFVDLFCIAIGFFASLRVLRREKPIALFSKGGFVSVPPVAAAAMLRIRVFTHDSDINPGLATRLNIKLGARALVAHRRSLVYLPISARRSAVVLGNPVREVLLNGKPEEGRRFAGLLRSDKRPLILVLGGSLGAREINKLVTNSLDRLLQIAAIVHQTGSGTPTCQDSRGYRSQPFFFEELPGLLAAAQLAIARCGAGSLWELAATKTPAVFIPLREATRGDQILNAALAEEVGMSITLEAGADSDRLEEIVMELLSNPAKLAKMSDATSAFSSRQAAEKIVEMLVENK
ncbi:UDP-N-acetylglucosamine--N-acetylmuramyl-(pentapeptide) pyrophosphoryl-undecaprenol N-acetylglucosamine transferase [Olavius algarvensis spirochete endosymbiont]|uniref:UDP-N-acetylglucosamine--N-acetylmuramyl- (pentapeptide) pyrophosphoryl-undecaprenol N-acetylglucosamine transferase n=1 Tax=Olavius algarvensis spirochete endosymbiont TaxID=260710 RepID=UPI000F2D0B7C|nr:UDP-N-acetylglucosamine--N-acetylmuramyl-(pentapeptide) pyrophosphoryl-undecaprenol N-acetylglucosamine transferase [Olavius algarvensis spirochete endosymbiont]VDA99145.1 UDP-N-acetylglucosamine--N-acetylmuramyl-(pentapeptide) pyrophosphoryl-undecaprenol N-acetylglucosamine transferase [Olavius algarvensis spirochete endosymbiont]